ncbi:pheromone precursor, partial [Biomphalaria glabrata]
MFLLTLVLIGTCSLPLTYGYSLAFCQSACGTPQSQTGEGTQLMKFMCGCMYHPTIEPQVPTVEGKHMIYLLPDPTLSTDDARVQPFANTSPKTTTEDICDLLCSVQMGGEA